MTEGRASDSSTPLNHILLQLAERFVRASGGRAERVLDEHGQWLAIEEATSAIAFAEAEGDELRLAPFLGEAEQARRWPYVISVGPSWIDGEQEMVVDAAALTKPSYAEEVLAHLTAALDYWTRSAQPPRLDEDPAGSSTEAPTAPDLHGVSFSEDTPEASPADTSSEGEHLSVAQMAADISDQWSWASSSARIPQISNLVVALAEPVERARISVSVKDGDIHFGSKTAYEGALPAGPTAFGSVHVPLSASVMSQVDERHGAECVITLEDVGAERVLARVDEAIDIQPRDLWLWQGDPRRSEQLVRLKQRRGELRATLEQDPGHPDHTALLAELEDLDRLINQGEGIGVLAHALLASFVRPNHPDVSAIAREAADRLGRTTGDSSFAAFQSSDIAVAEQRADATVNAIYEALQARSIVYSEPPPGWDYRGEGQRIRDHGPVAAGGLGTCLDTTVLTAAVIEQVGLMPVLVLIRGHIFVGYWRRDPLAPRGPKPEWYPDTPSLEDPGAVSSLVEGGWLGVIETTTFTAGNDVSSSDARSVARHQKVPSGVGDGFAVLIDVSAARRAGVSPLPAVKQRDDGVTEVVEYRPGGTSTVTEVEPDSALRERQVDNHPPRYRTWKSSLFSLNATNALLNLGSSARTQPLVLPPAGLGLLEDRLNQDVSFTLHSGYDIPAVWNARDFHNALQLLDSDEPEHHEALLSQLHDRRLYVQRIGRSGGQLAALSPATFFREIRSMAHHAKTARDERGMNPLFLCIGMLRWPHKPGVFADAPLILVPVSITATRGRQEFSLRLDASQQTTPNAALLEWLRREHGLSIPGLSEPLSDRAGIDVDGVLAEVRTAVAQRGLPFDVAAQARLATLDLSAFRMWQDLNLHAEGFLERPLVRHLVHTPTEPFQDPAISAAGNAADDAAMAEELEKLETPIPADSTQKRAVLWARQGRTFVLQGPPGTGKSQTITNIVAECVMTGLRVLFVAEKGTALAVVQRRLDAIGLGPFTLNLHHEGSNATEVRAQLRRALTATVTPDPIATESARRRLRNARFELQQYPQRLHEPNAAGLSAYTAHDELLVLGDGPTMPIPAPLVAHQADRIEALRELFQDLQQWTSAAGVRPDHPWRLAGTGAGEPFDVENVGQAVTAVLEGTRWSTTTTGALREVLDGVTHPKQIEVLAAAANRALPTGDELADVLTAEWPTAATEAVSAAERTVQNSASNLHQFSPDFFELDLPALATDLEQARASGIFGRGKRQAAALTPLASVAPPDLDLQPGNAATILNDLIAAQEAGASAVRGLSSVPGLRSVVPRNPYLPQALQPVRNRLDQLLEATQDLRGADEWTQRVHHLARAGHLAAHEQALTLFATAWQQLWDHLVIDDSDFQTWRADRCLLTATAAHAETWRRQVELERLLPLQHWCTLIRQLEPLRAAALDEARSQLLEATLPASVAEDALARGVAKASLSERVATAGLDRFNAVAHDQRVTSYSTAQQEVRQHWATDGPSLLLERRGGGGTGKKTGGLSRELEKTTRRLGTRAVLRKYGEAVQELTPLVLCSPSSVVDLIEPGVMEFDLVIFDEASQITVPEAVGALGRARAAIVVGDSKQMPPTRQVGGGPSDDQDVDDPDIEEVVEDQESILSECELARVPTLSLSWHYRSQDEALIAFSNRAYYKGDLSSFPTPTLLSAETGVTFRRVDGQYLRAGSKKVDLGNGVVAGSNTNPTEALEIVEEIRRLVHQSTALPSVGIVTFNESQRQLIEDLLLASPDRKVADVMDESKMGRGEALFVKALEQVQGDERDMILFSIAFSKQANGKIPTNFGPLSNSGGERRLNVAVTRARRKNVVFCSFEPNELDVSGSTYNGPKDLKAFLAFAKAAGSSDEPGQATARTAIRDRHRDDVAAALRAAGLHVMSDVGLSNFRLDLVLARPENPQRPLLPVLLDGESWRQRSTVSDRDVLPVEVLENLMGWPKVARIWWPMWLQNRQEVIDSVLSEVERAAGALDVEVVEPSQATTTPTRPAQAPEPTDRQMAAEPGPPDELHVATASSSAFDAAGEPERGATASELALDPQPEEQTERDSRSARIDNLPRTQRETVALTVPPEEPATGQGRSAEDGLSSVSEFVPAHSNLVGGREVLDALPDRAAAATVREQVLDVIQTEGPVELARLTRLVARRFGLNAVRAARADDIARLVPRGQLKRGRLGAFAWPADLDPSTWRGFRFVDPEGTRSLDEVAPEEITNAMLAVRSHDPEASDEAVLRLTAELFGIVRLGANVRARLMAVHRKLPAAPVDVDEPSAVEAEENLAAAPVTSRQAESDEVLRDRYEGEPQRAAQDEPAAMDAFDVQDLVDHGCAAGIVALVRQAQEQHPVVKLSNSRDRQSVPLMGRPGTQVALYPMRKRIAIALPPEDAGHFATVLGVEVEKKSATTHYIHLRDQQLLDPDLAATALQAAVRGLEEMSKRHKAR